MQISSKMIYFEKKKSIFFYFAQHSRTLISMNAFECDERLWDRHKNHSHNSIFIPHILKWPD